MDFYKYLLIKNVELFFNTNPILFHKFCFKF